MITITCDLCGARKEFQSEVTATAFGWTVAEDEPHATDLHGICPLCDTTAD